MDTVLPSTPASRTAARMTVLVCGANGFIGRALCAQLEAGGHRVLRGVRQAAVRRRDRLREGRDPDAWLARLEGVDVVINAVGILADQRGTTLDAVHRAAPSPLHRAAARRDQISARRRAWRYALLREQVRSRPLPADAADRLPDRASALVSARTARRRGFSGCSRACRCGPAGEAAVSNCARARRRSRRIVARCVDVRRPATVIDVVGADEVEYREMLARYRAALGLRRPFASDCRAAGVAAVLLGTLPGAIFTTRRGRCCVAGTPAIRPPPRMLGRPPRGSTARKPPRCDALAMCVAAVARRAGDRGSGRPSPARSSIRCTRASLLAPRAPDGLPALLALYAASALDFAFGVATVVAPSRRLWVAQAALIVAYSAVIAVTMPGLLAEPFGPVLKNVPILAILLILFQKKNNHEYLSRHQGASHPVFGADGRHRVRHRVLPVLREPHALGARDRGRVAARGARGLVVHDARRDLPAGIGLGSRTRPAGRGIRRGSWRRSRCMRLPVRAGCRSCGCRSNWPRWRARCMAMPRCRSATGAMRRWELLGYPAFFAMLTVYFLMVLKPM